MTAGHAGGVLPYDSPSAMDPPEGTAWAALLEHVPPGSSVLDIGCSTGFFAVAMKRKGCHVTGVDVNPDAVEVARTRCDAVHIGDVAALLAERALPAGAFDVIVAADLLEHLVDPWTVVRACASLLRPNGVFLASVPNVTHASVILEMCRGRFPLQPEGLLDRTHLRFFGEESALDLFRQAGYRAAVVAKTRLDPRTTEFASRLESVPDSVIDFIDENPNADTYQFIIRASPGDLQQEARNEAHESPGHLRNRLVGEANELRAQLKEYHESAVARIEEIATLRTQLAGYHEAALARGREAEELHGRLAAYHTSLVATRDALGEAERRATTAEAQLDAATALASRYRRREQSCRALVAGLAPRSALRVLYVADQFQAPFRYRCEHGVLQLRQAGVVANVMDAGDPGLLDALRSYSIVILFRLPWSPRVEQLVERARAGGATVIFESDDLIFDPATEGLVPFLADFPEALRRSYRECFDRMRATFDACDYFIGSMPALVRHAETLGMDGFLHPNLVSPAYVRMSRLLRPLRRALAAPPTIAYLSGSNTHDRDLASIGGALARVMKEHPRARLLICGFVDDLPRALEPFANRIKRLAYQHWRAYPWALARCTVALAPASTINDFTNGKSALKFFEAGIFGVPTVATPTEAFRDAIDDGVNGFLARDEREWFEKTMLALDRRRSRAMGKRARRRVLARYSFAAHRGRLAGLLHPLIGRSAGRPPSLLPPNPAERDGMPWEQRRAFARHRVALLRDRIAFEETSAATWVDPADPGPFEAPLALLQAEGGSAERGVVWHGERIREWMPLPDLERRSARDWEAVGGDPALVSPPVDLDTTRHRYLVVRMRARPTALPALAQFFWLSDQEQGFHETRSVCWPLPSDGALHTYVVDLHQTRWPRSSKIRMVRFDPMTSSGPVMIDTIAFLTDAPPGVAEGAVRRALAARHLAGLGLECGALQNPLALPASAHVVYVDRLTEPQAREHYPELDGQPLVRPGLVGDLHRLPVRDAALDFCVGNHLLEHARDPIGALRELLRVVRPGGVLFVSVPDVDNPLDRGRPVTAFAHLLADHEPGADRTADDHAHYRESVASSHPEMNEPQQRDLTARFIGQAYSIHFHTFDEDAFRRLLDHVCAQMNAEVAEIIRNVTTGFHEYVAIVRRIDTTARAKPDAGRAGPPAAAEAPLPHYGRWWYPLYLRVAERVPVGLRRRARERIERRIRRQP